MFPEDDRNLVGRPGEYTVVVFGPEKEKEIQNTEGLCNSCLLGRTARIVKSAL